MAVFSDCQRHATVFVGWIRLAEDALNPPIAVGELDSGKDTDIAVPGLCLCRSEDPGRVARGTVSGLGLSRDAEWLAPDAVSASRFFLRAWFSLGVWFSLGAQLASLALVSRY